MQLEVGRWGGEEPSACASRVTHRDVSPDAVGTAQRMLRTLCTQGSSQASAALLGCSQLIDETLEWRVHALNDG